MAELLTRNISEDQRKILKDAQKDNFHEPESTMAYIKLATCKRTYNPEVSKISWNSHPKLPKIHEILMYFIKEDGGEEKVNAQPKGPRERRIENFLRKKAEEGEDEDEE